MKKPVDDVNAYDRIQNTLLSHSVHMLSGEIEQENIDTCINWILYESLDPKPKTLTLYINSTGGDLYCAFALIDAMRTCHHTIRTVGIGAVMSAAFLIFISGTKGERFIGRSASLMCHQYSETAEGKHHDLKAAMKEGEHCNSKMLSIISTATNLPVTKIKAKLLSATDVYLTPEDAIRLNIADKML